MIKSFSITCIAFLALASRDATAQSGSCRSPDQFASLVRSSLSAVVASADSAASHARAGFRLPRASASEVTLVSDDNICALAKQAHLVAVGRPGETAGSVWVVKVGTTRYVVFDGQHAVAGREQQVVFDASFQYLVTIWGG